MDLVESCLENLVGVEIRLLPRSQLFQVHQDLELTYPI